METDYVEAVKWLRKAAEQGHIEAPYELGEYYSDSQQDHVEAVKWFRKAAEQGNSYWMAYAYLVRAYYRGVGVEQDYGEAMKWCQKACQQAIERDDWTAVEFSYPLGMMYYEGKGVEQDYDKAVKWSREAAECGYSAAQYQLGMMYYEDKGVEQDYVEAYIWLNLAAEKDNQDACEARDRIERQMTPAQLAEAQRQAPEWDGYKWRARPKASTSS